MKARNTDLIDKKKKRKFTSKKAQLNLICLNTDLYMLCQYIYIYIYIYEVKN